MILLDTSILLRLADFNAPARLQQTANAILKLHRQGQQSVIMPQCIIEAWCVLTRPANVNGLGMTPADAARLKAGWELLYAIMPDNTDIYAKWSQLVMTNNITGRQVHDTRLAAAAIVHGIDSILTYNVKDFKRFEPAITVIDPATV